MAKERRGDLLEGHPEKSPDMRPAEYNRKKLEMLKKLAEQQVKMSK
jgi:transposase